MEDGLVLKTKDYSIFKFVNFNRDKRRKHIEAMKKVLLKENLLKFHPILVNQNMEVIDGQHRLAAAQELGLEIFYMSGDISYEHILNANLVQRKASISDILKFYAVKDHKEDYIKLRKFCEILEINPKALLGLLFGACTPSLVEFIKSGNFRLPQNSKAPEEIVESFKNFMSFIKERKVKPFSMFSSHNFTIAYRNLFMLNGFNEGIFLSKLQMRWFELVPQVNSHEWTKRLIDIYNWKNHTPLSLS
jgi:hypothetical protein